MPKESLGIFGAKTFISIGPALMYANTNQHIFCIVSSGENQLKPSNIAWFYQPETLTDPGAVLLNNNFNASLASANS